MSGSLDDVKNRILGRVQLAGLIGEQVALTTRSGRPMGCCPFHAEKSPSFVIYDDHYFCFGCKARGDAIDYVRLREGIAYVDALRFLAKKYAIEAPELDQARGKQDQHQRDSTLYKMMLEAQEFYASELWQPAGEPAREYLRGRGFTDENIKAFGFGLTPELHYGLVKMLRGRGYKEPDMVACSLATQPESNDRPPYDFLRQRVTLPIHDGHGRTIAFGGRTMDAAVQPKYLNSRETRLFDKKATLFGFDKARKLMRDKGRAIVTEGYMDTLQLWQNGFTETVACLGTAFTEWHLKQLANATGQVILLFDGDSAGQRANLQAVTVALAMPGVHVKVVALSGGEDPDSFVRKNGAAALEALLVQSIDLFDFAVREKVKVTHPLAIPELVSKEFVPWLAKIPDRLQRSFLISRIAQQTGIPAARIETQVFTPPGSVGQGVVSAARQGGSLGDVPLPPLESGAFDLFGHVFHATPGEFNARKVLEQVLGELTLSVEHTALLEEMLTVLDQGMSPAARDGKDWVAGLDPAVTLLLDQLRKRAPAFACSDRPQKLDRVIAHLKALRVKGTIQRLKAEMTRLASLPGSQDEVRQLLKTIAELNVDPNKAGSTP